MEALSSSFTLAISKTFPITNHHASSLSLSPTKFLYPKHTHFDKSLSLSPRYLSFTPLLSTSKLSDTAFTSTSSTETHNRHWIVLMEKPPPGVTSKSQLLDYYVAPLKRVLGSEKDAQMCIYDASFDTHFGFCCDIDEETSRELASVPGVLSVRPDPDHGSEKKDYRMTNVQLSNLSNSEIGKMPLFPAGSTKRWLVRVEKPGSGVVTKPQMVDYFAQLLTKVLGNESDAQMCIYHISWQSNFGFCCEIDDECARQLVGVPGVLSVSPDENLDSEYKDYRGDNSIRNSTGPDSSKQSQAPPVKTKKLFITGLSFYTSEKTLRAAFEGFGEIVEVKIIMDKISKRSKGYAFIEYTTEESASTALKEMNGKIINGWMIVVDVATDKRPPRYNKGRPAPGS